MKTHAICLFLSLALCASRAFAIADAAKFPFRKGINLSRLESWTMTSAGYLGQDSTYTALKQKGFDHIRLPVYLRNYFDRDNQALTSDMSTIDGILDKCEAAGLYVFLDFHGWSGINTTNSTDKADFLKIWELVSARYKDRSDYVIYELLNEPHDTEGGNLNAANLNALQAEVMPLIRQHDPNRLVLLAAAEWNGPWKLSELVIPANSGRIGVVCHTYAPLDFTHQGATWAGHSNAHVSFTSTDKTETGTKDLDNAFRWIDDFQEKTGIPVVMNEFGVYQNSQATDSEILDWTSYVARNCESNGIAWSWWEYNSGFGAYNNGQWRARVMNGLFPAEPAGNTYASSFNAADYAKTMTISFPGYAGASALSGFPALVKLSSAIPGFSYADFERTGGDDLRFTDSSGNLIPHEIDTWNSNGVSTVWVKVPSLTSATTITAHYGCALPVAIDSSKVWDDDYVGVWHLGESGLPLRESSLVSTDFTKQNGSGIQYAAAGIVGGSVDFGASGNSRMVTAQDCDALDGFTNCTVEAWTYQTSHTTAAILSKRYSANKNLSYFLYDNGSKTQFNVAATDSTSGNSAQITPTLNQWTHQAYTFSAGTIRGYQDGGKVGSDKTLSFSTINASDGYLHLGNFCRNGAWNADTRNFPGKIDEVRISKVARSADWLQATHDTVANANFATYAMDGGEPTPSPAGYGPLATNLYAKSMNILFAGIQANVTLTNFPVLVKLSTAIDGFSYSDFNRQNGGDLRFADANGNLVPHEIDTWDESGISTVWVRVPLLKKKSYITAHYGFTGTGDPAAVDPKDVWDDDYVGVWHLGESGLPLKESSETSSDFETSHGETIHFATNGIVGGSVGFPPDGLTNAVVAPDHDALDGFGKFTVEFWTHQDEHKKDAGILAKRNTYNNQAAYYFYDAGTTIPFCIGTNTAAAAKWCFNQDQTLGDWTHLAYSADMTVTTKNVHGFKNGTMNGWEPNVEFFALMPNCTSDLILGNLGATSKDNSFNGRIDEVRISKTVRSPAWVKASHDTVRNASFAVCSFGEIDFGENITNLLLKAQTEKENPIDYVENETIRFDFFLDGVVALPLEVRAREPLHVIWTRTGDDGVTVKGTNAISLAQGFSMTTSLATNGIVRVVGTLVGSDYRALEYYNEKNEKKNITFGGGAGVATEKMKLSSVEPADFDSFWSEAKAKLATVPFDASNVELVDVTPSSLTNSYIIYAAKIPCYGPRPVTGWLTVPRRPQAGGVPIQANFDGYGCATTAPKVPTYGAGQKVYFAVNAHGYDMVGHNDQYYKDFSDYINYTNRTFNGTRYGYALAPQDYDNPTNTYFYYMAMRVMRAFDYLKTRPEWNGRDVYAEGGSQGGLQTMWAGGLVEGITKIRPGITWGCDIGDPYPNNPGPLLSRSWGIPSVPGAFYFDSALHAKRVPRDCTAEITRLGMGDYTCPPRGVLLSYYNMKCQVSAKLVQGSDHGYVPPEPNQTFIISKAADAGVSASLAGAAAAPGFAWTNATATVTVSNASSIPEGAKVRLSVADASGAVLGTVDRDWTGTGEYAFDTAGAIGGATFADGFDYTLTFSLVDAGGTALVEDTAATSLRLGASAPWFSADAATATVAGGSWAATPAIENGAYVVGTNTSFTATEGCEGYARIEFTLPDNSGVSASILPELLTFATQNGERASIVAVAGSGGSSVWHGLVQENGALAWKALEGADDSSASGSAAFELDTTAATPRVSYFVWDAGAAPPAFVRLHDANGAEWFDAPGSGATMAGHLDFLGDGAVSGFAGQMLDKAVAEADGVRYDSLAEAIAAGDVTLLTNAEWPADMPAGTISVDPDGHTLLRGGVAVAGGTVVVDSGPVALAGEGTIRVSFANLANIGVATAGLSPNELAAALAEDGANGIPKWQSYVLGLDTTDPDALPFADIAIVDADNTVEVSARGMNVNEASGATVTYRVYEIPDLSNPDADTAVGTPATPGTPIELPEGNATSRFFRIKVSIAIP